MSDIHGDVGSYVANALDDAERATFEEHLAVCETCSREVREFSETTAELGVLTQTAPPPELRASVLAAIGSVRPLPPPAEESAPRRALPEENRPVVVDHPRDELAIARQRRVNRVLRFAVAAAVVVALALGGVVYNLSQQNQTQLAQERAQLAQRQAETELMSAPDLTVRPATIGGKSGSYLMSPKLDRGLFTVADLPPAGKGRTYQLWTVHDGDFVGSGLFEGGQAVRAWIDNVDGAEAMGITVEPAGGSDQPTTEKLALANV